MKKKLIILLISLVAIITTVGMVGCCKEEPLTPGGKNDGLINNVNDLSIILGKEYLYPPEDDLIYRIRIASRPVVATNPAVFSENVSKIEMFLIIDNVKTQLTMEKVINPYDFSDDTEYELINGLKVYSYIDLKVKKGGVLFQYSNMFYETCVDIESKVFEKLTDAQIEHYLQSLKDYIATFKLYAE